VTEGPGATYAQAGVDIDAGERAVELIRDRVAATRRPEVYGDLGGFAGLFRIDERRLLATSTDGVGTKLAIAQALDRHDTAGLDLVGMVVDDLVVCGAEPLFLTDYLACGQLDPDRVAAIVGGVAYGCRKAGCALLGGETAEHPGVMRPDDYDLAGAGVGVVDVDRLLGPDRVRPGDTVVAMAASGLHANGFSLVRHVLKAAGLSLDATPPELGGARLGDVLLTPTRVYARDCLALDAEAGVHAFAHVTGGGLAANLARVLPAGVEAVLDRSTWTPPPIFAFVADRGAVSGEDMERTFNQGIGMVALVAADATDQAVGALADRGVEADVIGEVDVADDECVPGQVSLIGHHPSDSRLGRGARSR
jgi:phosphoribosylformylglycinamidine cyclo-ligase